MTARAARTRIIRLRYIVTMTFASLTTALALPAMVPASCYFPLLVRRYQQQRLRHLCASTRTLVLSYDDGPGEHLTPQVLELLHAHRAPATFFLTGRRAVDHPELVDAIIKRGHEVGCHTHAHLHPWRTSALRAVADIRRGYRTLARWIPPDAMFRPPYGKMTLPTWAALRRRRVPIGWWTITAGDVRHALPEPEEAAQRAERQGGGVVLLHDFHRCPDRAAFVLQATRCLLEIAARRGWALRTLGDLLAGKAKRAA